MKLTRWRHRLPVIFMSRHVASQFPWFPTISVKPRRIHATWNATWNAPIHVPMTGGRKPLTSSARVQSSFASWSTKSSQPKMYSAFAWTPSIVVGR
ncbi:hypothetical protein EFD56_14875 [Rhizobium phaseoli]|nr:hypothetical protein EFD56_14875 [Rhizobium phaseoli]